MFLDKLSSSNQGIGMEFGAAKGKTIGEYSNKEWDKLLERVDNVIEEYKEDLKQREEQALEEQKEKKEQEEQAVRDSVCLNKHYQQLNVRRESEETLDNIPKVKGSMEEYIDKHAIERIVGYRGKIPYSAMADENGIIEYKGAVFVGDPRSNSLCLGDMSDPNEVMTIQLATGGFLKVNYDNIDTLCDAIDMFSPEDINVIMQAIANRNRMEQIKQHIDDETSGMQVLEKNKNTSIYA